MTGYTKPTRKSDIKRAWHFFDVKGKILGRTASEIAQKLVGKHKPYFVRHLDCGDFVVIVNASLVSVTGDKEDKKVYTYYSGYPGGLKKKTLWELRQDKSPEIIRHAVYGMLPKNKLRKQFMKRLYIFKDENHPHKDKFIRKEAQPEE